MSKDKPGLIRGFFSLIGKFFSALRWLINAVFMLILLVIVINLFFGGDAKPLPEKAALRLIPSGVLVEQRSYTDPLTQLMEQSAAYDAETPVRDLVDAIDAASSDKRITALLLQLDYLNGGGLSKLEEVGKALERFKHSGKPVIAMGDNYTQDQYYLASYADEIHLNPMGGVMITGFGYFGSYLKSAADKLKININVFRAGDFKSAVEPFTRDNMSAEARQNTTAWLNELWSLYTSEVETTRKLDKGAIDHYVDTLYQDLVPLQGDLSRLALEAGLVDQLSTRPVMGRRMAELVGQNKDGFFNIDHKTYLAHHKLLNFDSQDKGDKAVGVIVASGNILDGDHPEGSIGGDSLSGLLQTARKDKDLKALVLRIDSPGGSAFASEVIRNELEETRRLMPVIVSMGSMAASGGYWIAAGADEIWAMPSTITGSIGVFGIVPTFEDSLAAIGIHSDGVGSTRLADMNHLDRPLSDEAGAIIQLSVDNIYNRFLNLVAEGRDSTPQAIDKIAGGRIWTGRQARELGLVDKLGTLENAIAAAGHRAGLKSWEVRYIERPLNFQEQLLKQLAGSAVSIGNWLAPFSADSLQSLLPAPLVQRAQRLTAEIQSLGKLNDPAGIYLQCFSCIQP